MKTIERILCPVDFSGLSRRALVLAFRLAGDFAAMLKVLHVVDHRELMLWQQTPLSDWLRDSRRRLENEIAALAARPEGVALEVDVVDGPAYRVIADKALEGRADLVVMGTHGYSEFDKLFLGSVTEKVLHLVTAPLLVVPRPEERSESPLGAAGEAEPFRTVVLATDLGPLAPLVAEGALFFARKYRARLLAVSVVMRPEVWTVGGAPWLSDAEVERLTSEMCRDRRQGLERLLPASLVGTVETELIVDDGLPPDEITRLAGQRRADLIVLGAHGPGRSELRWVGSTCHRVIRAAPCPVLVVRGRA